MAISTHPGNRTRFLLFFFLMFSSVFNSHPLLASVLPAFERLAPLSSPQVQEPTSVALDRSGRLYVAKTTSDSVAVFSQSGGYLGSIDGLAEPICVTTDADDHIYIGNKRTGSVSVYDRGFSLLFTLGQGDGEFGFPGGIAVDTTANKIYVADRNSSSVKIYNADGTFNVSLGEVGNGDGQFFHPVSLVIDPVAGELIVLDLQQRLDTYSNSMIDGARLQFFDLNGNFLRGYSKFGYSIDAGELVKPAHVTVDSESRLYVTDSSREKILVYDNSATFLGLIAVPDYSLRTPLGLTIGASNRLYVCSFLADQVEVYGIDQYFALKVTSPELSFRVIEGRTNPAPQNITLNNIGNTPLTWTAGSSSSWIIPAETSGPLPVAGTGSLEVRVNAEDLTVGRYRGSVDITIDSGAQESVNVTLSVLPNPLQVSPTSLTFETEVGAIPASQPLSISSNNLEPGTGGWTAAIDQSWLSVSTTSGVIPDEIQAYITDTTNLTAGTHTGTITFSSLGTDPAPVEVVVTLNLTDPLDPPADPTVDPPPPAVPPGSGHSSKNWALNQVVAGISLNGIWGSSSRDIFAVGAAGTILHNNGTEWSTMDSGSTHTLSSVWGRSKDDVYAVGDSGLILHYNGSNWTPVPTAGEPTLRDVTGSQSNMLAIGALGSISSDPPSAYPSVPGPALSSIWGSSASDIFVTGEAGAVLHYNGSSWIPMVSQTTLWLNSIWGSSATDVFAVGEQGKIVHYNGTVWTPMDSGTTENLQSVWGSSDSDVFAVGANGLLLHYDGTLWTPISSGATVTLNDVWVSAKSDIYAVGENGYIVSGTNRFPWQLFMTVIMSNTADRKIVPENAP